MPVIKVGDWNLARRILATASPKLRMALDRATLQEAHFMRGKIIEGLVSQAPGGKTFKPISNATLAIRKFKRFSGTKALLVRGDLKNSISVKRESDGCFVGILRTARGRGGAPIANVAELNEFGSRPIVIPVTPKMKAFLAAAFRRGGGGSGGTGGGGGGLGVIVVQIPARPFIRPVAEKFYGNRHEVSSRFLRRVGILLGGDFGIVV